MLDFIATYILIPHAEAATNIGTLMAKVNRFVLNPLITLMFVVAFVVFIWGLFVFFQAKGGNGSDEDLETGKRHALWGIIGMVIMISVFGIMQFLISSLGVRGINPESSEIGNLNTTGN